MTHTYQLTGMTCGGCENKVKSSLLVLPNIEAVEVFKDTSTATITMKKSIDLNTLQDALGGLDSKYKIATLAQTESVGEYKSWIEAYKPILLIFGYISAIALIGSYQLQSLDLMVFMRLFMAGFFLTFSFFKLLNLKGFAESYAMYDIVAKTFSGWGYIYAFTELGLGLGFALNLSPVLLNWATLIVMTVSILGVLESVVNKKRIQCACLGAVFNLPMSTVTIVEDALMIAMSAGMLFLL